MKLQARYSESGVWKDAGLVEAESVPDAVRQLAQMMREAGSTAGDLREYRSPGWYVEQGYDTEVAKLAARGVNNTADPVAKVHFTVDDGWYWYRFLEGLANISGCYYFTPHD